MSSIEFYVIRVYDMEQTSLRPAKKESLYEHLIKGKWRSNTNQRLVIIWVPFKLF